MSPEVPVTYTLSVATPPPLPTAQVRPENNGAVSPIWKLVVVSAGLAPKKTYPTLVSLAGRYWIVQPTRVEDAASASWNVLVTAMVTLTCVVVLPLPEREVTGSGLLGVTGEYGGFPFVEKLGTTGAWAPAGSTTTQSKLSATRSFFISNILSSTMLLVARRAIPETSMRHETVRTLPVRQIRV